MTRFFLRLYCCYFILALLRAVERRFGVAGLLVLAVFILLPLAALRFLPFLTRIGAFAP